jgi:hypothetical protein
VNCWWQNGHALSLGALLLLPFADTSAVDPGVPICSVMVTACTTRRWISHRRISCTEKVRGEWDRGRHDGYTLERRGILGEVGQPTVRPIQGVCSFHSLLLPRLGLLFRLRSGIRMRQIYRTPARGKSSFELLNTTRDETRDCGAGNSSNCSHFIIQTVNEDSW